MVLEWWSAQGGRYLRWDGIWQGPTGVGGTLGKGWGQSPELAAVGSGHPSWFGIRDHSRLVGWGGTWLIQEKCVISNLHTGASLVTVGRRDCQSCRFGLP